MIGVRSGAQEVDGTIVSSVYFIFEVSYLSGVLQKDEGEIAAIQYWDISDIEQSREIVELSKEMILSAWQTTNGLYKGKPIQTNTSYKTYNTIFQTHKGLDSIINWLLVSYFSLK